MPGSSDCTLGCEQLESYLRQMSAESRRTYLVRHKHSLHEKVAVAARHGNKLLLELLLDLFSPNDRVTILKKQCRNGKLPLHHCLGGETTRHMDALKYLLSCVPKYQLYSLLTAYSSQYHNALHMAAKHNNGNAADVLIAALPIYKRFEYISQVAGLQKQTVLEFNINDEFRATVQRFMISEVPESNLSELASSSYSHEDIYISWPGELEGPEAVLGYCEECHPHRQKEAKRLSRARRRNLRPSRLTCDDASNYVFVNYASALQHIDEFLEFVKLSKTVKLLLDCRNSRGLTILHIVAKDNRADIIEKIFQAIHTFPLAMKWNLLTEKSASGKTPLHYAAQYSSFKALKLLLFYAKHRDSELCEQNDGKGNDAKSYANSDIKEFLKLVPDYYWHTFSKPPTVLIFYNKFEGDADWERHYAEGEKEHVVNGFRSLGIRPRTYTDFDGCSIARTVRNILEEDEPVSAMVVLIMSHGEENFVYDKRKRQLPIMALKHALCPTKLDDIPKVLMIQACRTRADQTPVSPRNARAAADPARPAGGSTRTSPPAGANSRTPVLTLREQEKNHLITIYPTLVGELAYQDYFMRIFSDVMVERPTSPPEDLLSMVTRVSGRMKSSDPVFTCSLKRKLVFRDPLKKYSILERLQQTFISKIWMR